MKKTIFLLLMVTTFLSCKKESLEPLQPEESYAPVTKLPANPLEFNWRKRHIIFTPDEITTETWQGKIFDSCANEWVNIDVVMINKYKQSPTTNPYWIYYEIDSKVTGMGETTANIYTGTGLMRDILISTADVETGNSRNIGFNYLKHLYTSPISEITEYRKAVFYQVNGKVIIETNTGVVSTCRSIP